VFAATPPIRDGGLGFFVLVALLVRSLRFDTGPLALVGMFLVGVELRILSFGAGVSDVSTVTRAAIELVLQGGNPYGVGYDVSVPPGASFPYGPLALLWYLPFSDPRILEVAISCLIAALLALRGRPLGLAIWATYPAFVTIASDGSNDTSAGLFLLIALVVLERLPMVGAALIGIAAGFKVYALAWLPPILAWAGLAPFLLGLVGAAAVWLPAVVLWGAGNILKSFQLTDINKLSPYYSVAHALQYLRQSPDRGLMTAAAYVWGALTALATLFVVRSHRGVVVGGVLVFVVTLYTGWWSTAAYLLAIGPVLCWYVDVWLGPGAGDRDGERGSDEIADPTRIRWPSDPIGRFTEAVSRRWPVSQ
jgi:hypothetical protein